MWHMLRNAMEYMEHPWERHYSDKQLITHSLIPVLYHCERFAELGILQRTRPLGDWGNNQNQMG